jgi:hypothetical protein
VCVSLRPSVEKAARIVRYSFPFAFTYILVLTHSCTYYVCFPYSRYVAVFRREIENKFLPVQLVR